MISLEPGEPLRLGIPWSEMQDKTGLKRDLLLDAVGFAAERFLRSTRWVDAIDEVLAGLGRAVETSRLQVYQVTNPGGDDPTCDMIAEWVAEGIVSQINNPLEHGFPLVGGGYGRWVGVLGSGGIISGRSEDFPESERAFLADEQIKAVLALPIFVEEEWWGWIGFDECVTNRDWTPVESDALRAAAGILGAAIQRQRSDTAREEAERRYETLVEQIPAVTYVESYSEQFAWLLYISPQIESMLGFPPETWIQDPLLWERQMHPEDKERVMALSEASTDEGSDYAAEYRMLSAAGSLVWVRDEAILVRDAPGSPQYWQGVMYDITEQKLATEHIQAAESRYRTLVEQIPAITYIEELGASGKLLYISPQLRHILGYEPEDWIADPGSWLAAVVVEDESTVTRNSNPDIGPGEAVLEYRVHAADGRVVWFRDSSVVIRDLEGKPLFWQGVMYDITEQRVVQERLSEAEHRFRTLVEQLPAVTYVDPVEGPVQYVYVSPQIEPMLGYPIAEWMATPGMSLAVTHPDDLDRVKEADEYSDRTGATFSAEFRMIAEDGHVVWVHDQAVLVRGDDDEPMFWQGIMIDTTERKFAEERLQEAEERYKALVEQLPAVTYIDDRTDQGHITYMSPQIEGFTGHSAAEFMEDRNLWLRLIHDEDRDRVNDEDNRAQETGEPFSVDYRLIDESGREWWIHDEAVVVSRSEDGEPVYWQGLMVDVTERKRAEDLERALEVEKETSQRLRDLDDMKNTFLTAVSHDLRTPLAAILGLAITLEREDINLAAKESADLTRRIASNARKLDRLVSDLLDLDRLSRGILEPQRRPTDVGALVRKVVDEADFLGDHPVQVQADSVVLAVDGAKVERIVENLLANAVRHTSVGTQVWIKVKHEADGVMIAVEDAGSGVLAELRDVVFEPFRQGNEGGHSPGVGIGLSLVARFAELHGGKAWVQEREGGGASFRVFLPGAPGDTHFT